MYERSIEPHSSGVNNAALLTDLLGALLEAGSVTEYAASRFADVLHGTVQLEEQALTVERVLKALRAHFERIARLQAAAFSQLPPEQAAELQEALDDLRGRLGIAAGALRRWNLGAESCAASARQASTAMTSVRTTISNAGAAAENLLLF
jgi:hypothetical protein